MSTTNKWLIGIGIVLLIAFAYALPFIMQGTTSAYGSGYGMMGGGNGSYGMHGGGFTDNGSFGGRGMMGNNASNGSFSNMRGGGMMSNGGYDSILWTGFTWVFGLSSLVLIGLGIAALLKYLRAA